MGHSSSDFLGRPVPGHEWPAAPSSQEFAALFVELRIPVQRYLFRVLRNTAAAEDLTQEVFLSLYRTLQEDTSIGDPRAWVFRVAHNLAINWATKQKNHGEVHPEGLCPGREFSDPRPDAFDVLLRLEQRQRILLSIRQLPPLEKRCLELRLGGHCYRKIAEVTGVSASTVVTSVTRAAAKLAGLLRCVPGRPK
ncbi:MAG: RNA polymerase sigma factor [Bryobacterales bacterium]|nr:RNA polymerase sigma factor [Bryobacterales bacterium]